MMMKLIVVILALVIGITSYFLGGSEPEHEVIFTASAPMPIGPYSQGIKVGNTLYVSGQVGMTVAERMDTASIEAEVMQALKNVEAIVTMAGMEMKHVVKSTLYVKDLKNFAKINEVYKLFFPLDPPARETVQVSGLPRNAHFEISVVAVK